MLPGIYSIASVSCVWCLHIVCVRERALDYV